MASSDASALIIPDCGQKAEEDGAVILASQGER